MLDYRPLAASGHPGSSRLAQGLALIWHGIVGGLVALAVCFLFLGRIAQLWPRLAWALAFAMVFLVVSGWLIRFSWRMHVAGQVSALRSSLLMHGPLAALSAALSASMYLSDAFNHQITFFLKPVAIVLVLLAIVATIVAEEAFLLPSPGRSIRLAMERSSRWVLPLSLVMLGLVQGSSYLWMIGNDFTRYWNIADAIRQWAGYPAMTTLALYRQIGEPPYTIDLPGFSTLLLASFSLAGHDIFAAMLPNLVANAALPLLLFAFFRRAGISRIVALAGSVVLATQPFLRLYTLNAPVPDAVFMALLMAATIVFQAVRPSPATTRRWLLLGLLAGATALTRPEGLFFLAFMGLALLPELRGRGPWIAAAVGLATLLPFVAIMRSAFGFFWPNNAGSTMGPQHIAVNLYWLQTKTLHWYADLLQLSDPELIIALALLAVMVIAGTVVLAKSRWKMALLPVSAAINLVIVFAVDQSVSGIHLWFDFFRHISYGLPYLSLPVLFLLDRLAHLVDKQLSARGSSSPNKAWSTRAASTILAVLLLGMSFWQIELLSHPSQTYGAGGTQLLNSDVWVTIQDLAEHRYQLPMLPHSWDDQGVLVISADFDREYLTRHLDLVRQFYEPYSVIQTNRGSQYELASILIILFCSAFTLAPYSVHGTRHA